MEDLESAEKYLGWPNENSYTKSTERASKSFAKGLRARIALFLAGKSEWPNEGLRYNLTDESERKAMYTIARDECVSIINQHCNQLGTTFDENFRNLCKEDVTAGKESIFEIPFSDGRGRVLYTWGGKHKTTDQWTGLAKGGVNGPTPTLWYDLIRMMLVVISLVYHTRGIMERRLYLVDLVAAGASENFALNG